jgi:hypothetical protein
MGNNHQWKLIEGYEDWKIYPVYQVMIMNIITLKNKSPDVARILRMI